MISNELTKIERLSKLTRIELTFSEKIRFSKELNRFTESTYLKKGNTRRPMSHPAGLVNSFRYRGTRAPLSQKDALKNSKSISNGYFKTNPELVCSQDEE
ncbi:MAG: hypothetical protein ABIE03_05400 [Patescibacteria group bacterium]|nr:hypothetical protein [Patescibacteria group bacterium]